MLARSLLRSSAAAASRATTVQTSAIASYALLGGLARFSSAPTVRFSISTAEWNRQSFFDTNLWWFSMERVDARHDHSLCAQGRQGVRDRRRPSVAWPHGRQAERQEGPPYQRQHCRGLCRLHGRRIHTHGASREQAGRVPGPADARVRGACQGVADRQVPAPPRGNPHCVGQQAVVHAHGQWRRRRAA
jgi:hypothetical protein